MSKTTPPPKHKPVTVEPSREDRIRKALAEARAGVAFLVGAQAKALEALDAALGVIGDGAPADPNASPIMTLKEAAAALRISRANVSGLVTSGELQGFRPSPGRVLIHRDDLFSYIQFKRGLSPEPAK